MRVMALLCLFIASWTAEAQDLVKLKAGMVTGIDQIGLPRPRQWDALIESDSFKALSGRVLHLVRAA